MSPSTPSTFLRKVVTAAGTSSAEKLEVNAGEKRKKPDVYQQDLEENNDGASPSKKVKLNNGKEMQTRPPREDGESRVPKRSMGIVIAYSGTGYHGFAKQVGQPDVRSIEALLENILYETGGISESNFGDKKSLQKVGWSRAARTDKGVHAAMNLISLKVTYEPPRDGDVRNIAEGADEQEYFDYILRRMNEKLPKQMRAFRMLRVIKKFDARACCDRRQYEYLFPCSPVVRAVNASQSSTVSKDATLVDLASQMNELMQNYVGTRNFHNFTNRLNANSKEASRYMLKIGVKLEEIKRGDEIVHAFRVTLLGQSFLLHQIRKMVGLAIQEMCGSARPGSIAEALSTKEKRAVPKVPAEGLFLDRLFFDAYNKYKVKPGQTVSLEPDEKLHEELEAFKAEVIWPEIADHLAKPASENVWWEYVDHIITYPYTEYGLDPTKMYPGREAENPTTDAGETENQVMAE